LDEPLVELPFIDEPPALEPLSVPVELQAANANAITFPISKV
jgi:hypothetical protein